jgi:hypothetical protein
MRRTRSGKTLAPPKSGARVWRFPIGANLEEPSA